MRGWPAPLEEASMTMTSTPVKRAVAMTLRKFYSHDVKSFEDGNARLENLERLGLDRTKR